MNIYHLPAEIWRHVFSYLSVREMVHMVVADEYFWGAVDMAEIDRAKGQLYCVGCKMAPAHGLYENNRCVDCYNGDTNITLRRAEYIFGLTTAELGKLPCVSGRSAHREHANSASVFKFKTVRDAALKKYGKRMGDAWLDLEAERRRAKAAQAAAEAEWTEKLRWGLAFLGIRFDEKCAGIARKYLKTGKSYDVALTRVQLHVRSERVRVPRAAIVNQRLDALGIDRSYYSEMSEKYAKDWAGYRNLDRIMQIIVNTLELERSDATPEQKLVWALDLRGVECETNSRLYDEYLAGKSRLTLPTIAERMFEMHLLQKHTNYDECFEDAMKIVAPYRDGISARENMTYCCQDLSNHCLAALGAVDEATAHSEPRCECGLSTRVVRSQAALDYVHCLDDCGVPQWMQWMQWMQY